MNKIIPNRKNLRDILDLLITCFAINPDFLDILHISNFNKSLLEKNGFQFSLCVCVCVCVF